MTHSTCYWPSRTTSFGGSTANHDESFERSDLPSHEVL